MRGGWCLVLFTDVGTVRKAACARSSVRLLAGIFRVWGAHVLEIRGKAEIWMAPFLYKVHRNDDTCACSLWQRCLRASFTYGNYECRSLYPFFLSSLATPIVDVAVLAHEVARRLSLELWHRDRTSPVQAFSAKLPSLLGKTQRVSSPIKQKASVR